MSHYYTPAQLADALRDMPLAAPVILTPAEYESLRDQCSIAAGAECGMVTRIAGHPIRIATWAPRVKDALIDMVED